MCQALGQATSVRMVRLRCDYKQSPNKHNFVLNKLKFTSHSCDTGGLGDCVPTYHPLYPKSQTDKADNIRNTARALSIEKTEAYIQR